MGEGGEGEEEAQVIPEVVDNNNNKRKLDDDIQLAKLKAQELLARFVNDGESKRPRLDDSSEDPPSSDSIPTFTQFSDTPQKLTSLPTENSQVGSAPFAAQPGSFATQPGSYYGSQGTSKKIDIPNGKVGVIIGKGGETIKYLQHQSGARIQITKDNEADQYSQTRDVELSGTTEQVSRAEQLIRDEIAKSDAGGSGSSGTRGSNSVPGTEQFSMKVPNNKVAIIIGKGGESIKNMQSRSGARIQIIPLHLPAGDTSTERTVYVNGTQEQIESAKELINEVISENRVRNSSMSTGYMQQGYRPPGNWGPPGPTPVQQPAYGYTQPGSYPTQPPSYYGNYGPQPAQWDHSNSSTATPQQSTGYNYYGQPGQSETGSQANAGYGYDQNPPSNSHNYDSGYPQHPQSYGQDNPAPAPYHEQQKQYGTASYETAPASSHPDGTTPSQAYGSQSSTAPAPAPVYPVTYSQPSSIPPVGYGSSQSYTGPPAYHSGYDQAGYTQPAYGGQQPAQLPPPVQQQMYVQGGYPPQSAPVQSTYVQVTNTPLYGQQQPHLQPATHGYPQQPGYGAERNGDGNTAPASYGSAPAAQEAVHPHS